MQATHESGVEHIEVVQLVVVAQSFPARPSALPDVRGFIRRQMSGTSVSDDDVRNLCDRVAEVLLDAAGVSGSIQVSLRIFGTGAEVDVLFALSPEQPGGRDAGVGDVPLVTRGGRIDDLGHRPAAARVSADDPVADRRDGTGSGAAAGAPDTGPHPPPPPPGAPPSFADWLSVRLREQGLTMEAAARRLGVSTKTISRWVSGATEPRLRDLYRIRDVLGEPPLR